MLAKSIIDRCELLSRRKKELEHKLASLEVISNPTEYKNLVLEYERLDKIVSVYTEIKDITQKIVELEKEEDVNDEEYKSMVQEEINSLTQKLELKELELYRMLVPEDVNERRNIILEIRAGTGGEEAALFAADLFRMYSKYCSKKGWKLEILDINETGLKGIKEVICYVTGKDVYKYLKYESGVHRVQRVPVTEASGRIHTSAATVAVLPEAEEIDVKINPNDLVIETFRASGHGGQHLQKTDSAVRIKHIPTGIVVQCQDERSQLKNKERAMKILRAKLYDMKQKEQIENIAQLRRSQVKSGDRSEKIRTYNFPQNRVTDHRINFSVYNIDEVMDGNLDEIISKLQQNELKEKIESLCTTT